MTPQVKRHQRRPGVGCVCINAGGCCRRATHRRLFVNGLDGKLLIVERNVSDLTPGETDLWGQSEKESARTSPLNLTQIIELGHL